jgi:hypothetical protein
MRLVKRGLRQAEHLLDNAEGRQQPLFTQVGEPCPQGIAFDEHHAIRSQTRLTSQSMQRTILGWVIEVRVGFSLQELHHNRVAATRSCRILTALARPIPALASR